MITKDELTKNYLEGVEKALTYLSDLSKPFNQKNESDPTENRRAYRLFNFAQGYVASGIRDPRVEALARDYLNLIEGDSIPWDDTASPLLAELRMVWGASSILGFWDINSRMVVKKWNDLFNPRWGTDKMCLLSGCQMAFGLGPHPQAIQQLVLRERTEGGKGDSTVWYCTEQEAYPGPLDWGHSNLIYWKDWVVKNSKAWASDTNGLTAKLRRNLLRDMDFHKGTTAESMRGIGGGKRTLDSSHGIYLWMSDYMPELLLVWATGWLNRIYDGYTTENDLATRGIARMVLAGCGLKALSKV